jgi:c-di-GMP-binding flagellar brake protein YcgR
MQNRNQQAPTLSEILNSLCEQSLNVNQRRESVRHPKSISVIVQPLNEDFLPDGEPFWVMSRDVSRNGMAFVNVLPTQHQYVRLRMLDYDASAVCRVCHCTAIGSDLPVYLTGVQFLEGEDHGEARADV